jgi:hypothetical protein
MTLQFKIMKNQLPHLKEYTKEEKEKAGLLFDEDSFQRGEVMKSQMPHLREWTAEEKEKSRQLFVEGSRQRAEVMRKAKEEYVHTQQR